MKGSSNLCLVFAIIMGILVFFIPLIDWWNNPQFTQMEIIMDYQSLFVLGLLFIGIMLWLSKYSEKSSRMPRYKNPPPPPDPESYGAKGNVKELYEYLESTALTLENVKVANPNQAFPLWVNIDDVYHLLKYYQEGTLKKFLDQQDSSGYWSFGYDACDFRMRDFPEPTCHHKWKFKMISGGSYSLRCTKCGFRKY